MDPEVTAMDPNPQIAEALTGCVEAHMNAVETALLEAAKKTVPGLNGNEVGMADAQNTIYHMIEAWAKRHQMVLDYSQMLKNAPYTHEKGLADILKKMRKVMAEIKNKHQVSRDRHYSKTNEEAAKKHLSEQLGGIANSPIGGQLMDWLLGKGEENDSR